MSKRKAFALRIDPEVFDAVRAWADDELRSVNAQIEFILTRALREAGRAREPSGRDRGAPGGDGDDGAGGGSG